MREKRSGENDLYTFHLEMIRLEMGCIGTGKTTVVAMDANGNGGKGEWRRPLNLAPAAA